MIINRRQKVAVIVWTIDPEGNKRFLLRHNKPFNGYGDEWTIVFGGIETKEEMLQAARREMLEEFGIKDIEDIFDLGYKVEFVGKNGPAEAHFVAAQVKDINIRIVLNEESIGYDWMTIEKVLTVMQYDDEKMAFKKLVTLK